MAKEAGKTLLMLLMTVIFCIVNSAYSRLKRQEEYCDSAVTYNAPEVANRTVIAYCRYYGDRFYECTAWNRLLARNHWVLADRIIPAEMWVNRNQHVQIAECKFYEGAHFRCRGKPTCINGVCQRKCSWGGRYEGTPHAGFREAAT